MKSVDKKIKIRIKKPWIAYPGSTIMQDYGEQPGKGYLLWDIKSRDEFNVEFRHVEHDSEFRTLEWQGSLRATLDEAKKLPRGSRIRIRSNVLIPQVEIKQITTELVALHGASEVVFKDESIIDSSTVALDKVTVKQHDLRDVDTLMECFRGYFSESTFSEQEWNDIRDLVTRYIQKADQEDGAARNVRWSLKELWFDNVFGYGKGNYIDFKKLSGITGIFGPNRAGKSSIIGTLLYTLFNTSDRGSIKNLHIINTRKSHCYSRLAFEIDGRNFYAERQSVRHETSKGIKHAVTSLNFAEVDANGRVIADLNGEQRTDTEKVLRSLVGSGDDLMLTGIAAQGDMNRFIDAGSSFRDQVMSKFLDLVIFEKMSQYAKEDSNHIKAEVRNAPDKNWDTLIATRSDELSKAQSEILRLEKLLKEKRSTLENLRVQLATSYTSDAITPADVQRVRDDIDALRAKISTTTSNVNDLISRLDKANIDAKSLRDQRDLIKADELKEQLKSVSKLKDVLARLRQEYEKEKQILSNQKKSILRLSDVPCGDQFPDCKYIKDSHRDKNKLPSQESNVNDLLLRIGEAEASLVALRFDQIEGDLNRYDELTKQLSDIDMRVTRLSHEIDRKRYECKQLEQSLTDKEMLLVDHLANVVEDDGSESLKKQIAELTGIVDDLDTKRVRAASKQGSLANEIERLRFEKERHNKLNSQWRIFEMFIQATSKKGIPAQIIHSQLPIINAEIGRILHGVVDYTIKFERDDDSTEIYIDYGDSKRLIELGSGMEKMISSLAIRVALQNASSLPRPDFLIIDEGFGTLDETNIEACNRLLVSLKRWFRSIIIISHIDGVKDITDNIIDITREGKDSKVFMD